MGIIISLTYTIYSLMSKQLKTYEEESKTILYYNIFNSALKREIHNSQNIKTLDEGFLLIYYKGEDVSYEIVDSKLLRRKENKVDTFDVNIINYKIEQTEENSVIQLNVKILNDTIKAFYQKQNHISNTINKRFLNED